MTSLTQFTFHNEYNVRIIDLNGELWFVASDVASALDYRMASDMTRFLDDDEKGGLTVYELSKRCGFVSGSRVLSNYVTRAEQGHSVKVDTAL
ncbi:BRO-N domain-containing protein, partial [Acinetobacter baumannii]|uniref:BRO-N domain-containing protein n=1 Tax=Acinetobacter baumannii TaxID=470 RepID=UPI001899F76D